MSQLLDELLTRFVFDVDQAGLRKYENAQKRINKNTKEMNKLNSTLLTGFKRFVGFLGLGIGVKSLVDTYRTLDLTRRSIEGLTQSTQDWEYIQKEAFRTATGIETVAKGYRNFYSAASMAGIDKGGIQTMYSNILEAGRAVGATQPQIQGALLALEQMFSKGKVSMEELRRQLGNALPGAFEVAAKSMGVTTEEFNKLIKKGVQATDLVPKFTAEYRKTFEKAFPEAMKSLDAAMVNLDNSWKIFQYDLMNGGAGKELAKGMVEISKFLQSPEAKSAVKVLGQGLGLMAKGLTFVAKHLKLILFLFGVNALMKIPMVLNKIKFGVLDLATKPFMTLKFGLQGVVEALAGALFYGGKSIPIFKAIGMSVGLLMKNLLPIIAIGAVITAIALALEDIFMYLRDPSALTLTRELAKKSPEFKETMENIKRGLKEFNKIWTESLAPALYDFMNAFNKWAAGAHPALGWIFETIIKGCAKAIEWVTALIRALNQIPGVEINDSASVKKNKWEQQLDKAKAAKIAIQPMNAIFKATPLTAPLAWASEKLVDLAIHKAEERIYNYNIDMKIEGGQNASPIEIAQAVDRQLSSQIDRAMSTISDKPRLYSTMADKLR